LFDVFDEAGSEDKSRPGGGVEAAVFRGLVAIGQAATSPLVDPDHAHGQAAAVAQRPDSCLSGGIAEIGAVVP
jgi:hypothetical protein